MTGMKTETPLLLTVALMVTVSILTSSVALAELGGEGEISLGVNCDDDTAGTCANRKSPLPGEPATCATTSTNPCTVTAVAPPGTSCSCQQKPDNTDECYCKSVN